MGCNFCNPAHDTCFWHTSAHIEGILLKGSYRPCVSMAGGALLAGYRRHGIRRLSRGRCELWLDNRPAYLKRFPWILQLRLAFINVWYKMDRFYNILSKKGIFFCIWLFMIKQFTKTINSIHLGSNVLKGVPLLSKFMLSTNNKQRIKPYFLRLVGKRVYLCCPSWCNKRTINIVWNTLSYV